MVFLTWSKQKEAEASLDAVNAAYGCPYTSQNGYRMEQWDVLEISADENQWGFYMPKPMLGISEEDLRGKLAGEFTENDKKPQSFIHEEPDFS